VADSKPPNHKIVDLQVADPGLADHNPPNREDAEFSTAPIKPSHLARSKQEPFYRHLSTSLILAARLGS